MSINGQMVTIIGVTPADFAGIERLGATLPDVTVPLTFDALFSRQPAARSTIPRMQQPTYWWLQLVGRLKPGVSIEQVGANFATVFQRTAKAGMAEYQSSLTADEKNLSINRQRGTAVPEFLVNSAAHGYYDVPPQTRRSAGFLSVVVVIVLLIVCANVANLSAVTWGRRGTARSRCASRLAPRVAGCSVSCSPRASFSRALGGALGGLVGYWLAGAASVRSDGAASTGGCSDSSPASAC